MKKIHAPIRIPTGVTLTVDATTVRVATGCGIIVSQGARLDVLEGSTLRAWCDGGLWNGVTVIGNGALAHPSIGAVTGGTYPSSATQHGVAYAVGTTQTPTTIRDAEVALGNFQGWIGPSAQLPDPGQLLLIPNPANGEVKVVLPKGMAETTVSLFDLRGQLVTTSVAAFGETVLHVDAYPNGIYFIHAGDGTKGYNAKLIIER